MDDASVPRNIVVTCAECSSNEDERRPFDLTDADVDGLTAVYECVNCGHRVRLELDP
jgi:DNA-directed RNA polymerase subunit M/transcription elongation factor TFIIS